MKPEEMDAVFDRHCQAELDKDVEAILDTLTDDAEHDVIGDPAGVLRGRAAIEPRYKELFTALEEDSFESLRRYHGADFFVDESRFVGRAIGPFMGFPGGNAPVDFRIMHVCEFRDGKISREQVWMDVGALVQQLTPAS
jgi:ketosteroid isomerase-like protein